MSSRVDSVANSASTAGPANDDNKPIPAIYHRDKAIDWRDPVVQAEIQELDLDPACPLSPLAVASLPRFRPEREPFPYLELEPWQLCPLGLLYPEAEFLVCRLPVLENQVLRLVGEELATIGIIAHAEPIGVVVDSTTMGEPDQEGKHHVRLDLGRLRFGVALVRRDWPRGQVAQVFDSEPHNEFVPRAIKTFGQIPQERVRGIPTRPEQDNGGRSIKWVRAFVPEYAKELWRSGDVARRAWVRNQMGLVPEGQNWRRRMMRAAGVPTAGDAIDNPVVLEATDE